MNIAVIPARAGSKRIPGKNIKDFQGSPMISYPIRACLASGKIDKVYVSTDSEEIADVARAHGAEVPFLRPQDLADDYTPLVPVIQQFLEELGEKGLRTCTCILPTSPFLRAEDLDHALGALGKGEAEFIFSAAEYPYPIQRALKKGDNGMVEMFSPEYKETRSQDLEPAFHDAGQFYAGTYEAWKKVENIFSAVSQMYLLPATRVVDIDTPEDWKKAETLYQCVQ